MGHPRNRLPPRPERDGKSTRTGSRGTMQAVPNPGGLSEASRGHGTGVSRVVMPRICVVKGAPSVPWRVRGGAGEEKHSRKELVVKPAGAGLFRNRQERERQVGGAGSCLDWPEAGGNSVESRAGARLEVQWPHGAENARKIHLGTFNHPPMPSFIHLQAHWESS